MYFCAEFYGFARNSIHIFFKKKKYESFPESTFNYIFQKVPENFKKRFNFYSQIMHFVDTACMFANTKMV